MSKVQFSESAQQNADLTFKLNRHYGRHGWLRLTPAYSVKLVSEILTASDRGIRVLDPFSGTATTPLCAAYAGNTATGVEINPFLTWFGNVKLATYSPACVRRASDALAHLISQATRKQARPVAPPPMHNLQRWWNPEKLDFLCKFKAALDNTIRHDCATRDLLLVVFCRLVINFSNAAFNHQSMSFKDKVKVDASKERQPALFDLEPDLAYIARTEGREILSSASNNPSGAASVIAGDSRSISNVVCGEYDLLITSPPYPNRMSYIRELRPYMYWLCYLNNGRDAGDMDWSTIGGTWGIATSRLLEWHRSPDGFYPPYFQTILSGIRKADNKSGILLSNYVAKYFEDMWHHLRDVANVMKIGGTVHYIIGNSRFYDTVVPVERLFAEMLTESGFSDARITRTRKRNSKKELYEFDVSARK
ncbi:hypothetical protein [Candidatus Thiosymbion oneisti]|uniref:hypothetical protein n=1 Tax=Candidatus Thiosymbion oneisti TaxID=589554 RepID=UPI000A61A2C4|nr:hypothetical protein [Candidatus Thiosymbion oneisti]